jgi:hypothetical protein
MWPGRLLHAKGQPPLACKSLFLKKIQQKYRDAKFQDL